MKTATFVAALAASGMMTSASANLIISEVVDGNLSGGTPKWVEFTNTGTTAIDLSAYSFGNFNNGGTTLGGGAATLLAGTLAAGDSFVFEYDNPVGSVFNSVYGFGSDQFSAPTGTGTSGRFTNGNDTYALYLGAATGDGSDATLIDLYGVIGVDGAGQVWEYTDGYAFRNFNVTSGSSTFDAAQWTFGGVDSLDLADDTVALQTLTTPGTHSFVPEPAAAALLGLGVVAMLRRRSA